MNTYEEIVAKYGYTDTAKCVVNEDGEKVLLSIDEDGACVRTLQKNGWMRINVYYKDGTCKELYQK